MLQQILRDMYVEPEILAELDDTQKQTLFCKMRQEQVRRWRLWDQKLLKEEQERQGKCRAGNGTKKSVQFLEGQNGEPWVWVMGEHRDDKSIDTILLEEATEKARALALKEAEQLRKSVERELTHLIEYQPLGDMEEKLDISPKQSELDDALEIYCSVDELRDRIQAMPEIDTRYRNERNTENTLHFHFREGKRDVLQEMSLSGTGADGGVSNRVAAWERRVAAARAGEILRGLRQRRARQARDAEQLAADTDLTWRERERKAKEAEQQMRSIARAAREEHRRSTLSAAHDNNDALLTNGGSKPASREAIEEWFRSKEAPRGAGRDKGQPADWFHGVITRSAAEALLLPLPPGSYLLRLSERLWGYAVSYRAPDRCKHYLVDATAGYRFLGDNHITHQSLGDLVRYHQAHVITESGAELLQHPCSPARTPDILLAGDQTRD